MSAPILAYTDQGHRLPIVLLHGFPLSRRMWDAQMKSWSRNLRIIAPDFRGFGDTPMGLGEFSMSGCAQDVHDLLTSLGIEKDVVLVGLSMGGYVCFEFVRKWQNTLRGLILVGTQAAADSVAAQQARYETADFVRREGSSALAERLIPRFLGKTTLASKSEVAETVRRLIQANSPESIAQACYGLASRSNATPFLSGIEIPALIVAGSEDALIPRLETETMHRQIRRSEVVVLEQCGHIVNLEQPERLDEIVTSFVNKVEKSEV